MFLAAGGLRSPGVGPLTSSNIVKVIEYRHAEWDHYFMTANIDEVAKLDNGTFVGWARTGQAFNVSLPAKDGSCPSGTQALYRLYNDGMGAAPNHRYTTDFAIFTVMQQLGWTPEGEGIGVIACVPT